MTPSFRVRFRQGDLEIEVESSNQKYVDSKLDELIAKGSKSKPQTGDGAAKEHSPAGKKRRRKAPAKNSNASDAGGDDSFADVVGIVSAINEAENHPAIEEHVLNKNGVLERIMLCVYFARDVDGPEALTTGEIEAITDQLNSRILMTNAAKKIKTNQKYFTADAVRKQGSKPRYRLNRSGIQAFEKLLRGEGLS